MSSGCSPSASLTQYSCSRELHDGGPGLRRERWNGEWGRAGEAETASKWSKMGTEDGYSTHNAMHRSRAQGTPHPLMYRSSRRSRMRFPSPPMAA